MKYLIRLLLLPIVAVFAILTTIALTISVMLPMLMIVSALGVAEEILSPLFLIAEIKINKQDTLLNINPRILAHLAGITVYFWIIPAIMIRFVVTGKILFISENDD